MVGRHTCDLPGRETTYFLTVRRRVLAPVINAPVDWGLPALTHAEVSIDREVFDQTWATLNPAFIRDETCEWTLAGVPTAQAASGGTLGPPTRTHPQSDRDMVVTTKVWSALAGGALTVMQAVATCGSVLTDPEESIRRIFLVTGLHAAA